MRRSGRLQMIRASVATRVSDPCRSTSICNSPSSDGRAGEDLVIGLFAGNALETSDHPLVDQASPLENPSVCGDLFSG